MKNTILKLGLISIFLISACNKKEANLSVRELNEKTDEKLISTIVSGVTDAGIPFPDGSVVIESNDGLRKIVLPKNYRFVMLYPNTMEIVEEDGGENGSEIGVTCNRIDGTGCSPVKYRRKYYCVLNDGCTNCKLKTSLMNEETVNIVGLYKPEEGIRIITKTREVGLKGELTSIKADLIDNASLPLFKIRNVKQALLDFYKFIYENDVPAFIINNEHKIPGEYKYIAINLFGNEAAIPVPINKLDGSEIIIENGTFGCKCNDSKPKGCKKNTFMGAQFCEAGACHSCTLID